MTIVLLAPAAGAEPRPTVQQVERRLRDLQDRAEQYNQAREGLASLTVRARAAQAQADQRRRSLAAARAAVARLAVEAYKRGESTPLDAVLSDDPSAYLAQAGLLPSLGERQVGAAHRLREELGQLAAAQVDLTAQRDAASAVAQRLDSQRGQLAAETRLANAELSRLRADERAAVLGASAGDRAAGASGASSAGSGSRATCDGAVAAAPSAAAKTAIGYACAHLGDPYVWAAAGPHAFDCSGLTMEAYGAAGISLPHSAQLQATYGTPVSLSALLPGDLVFGHSPISHVAIYVGGGLMIEAPQTGDVVKISSLRSPVAAVRL
jgi:cell wall-associated NlpC family hydrolase